MTVDDNVAYGLRVRGVARAERRRRAAEALEMVRLDGFGSRRPGQLSGGQRQRVALARAIVNRPRVLLLDEPLGALDLKLRQEMQLELKRIQQEVGITFLYVTHDQEEALTMSDRLAVFDAAGSAQVGAPAEVYEQPASAFVAGLRRHVERARARRPALHRAPREGAAAGGRAARRAARRARAGSSTSATPGCSRASSSRSTPAATAGRPPEPRHVPADAVEERGREVTVAWRAEHTYAVGDGPVHNEVEVVHEEPRDVGGAAGRRDVLDRRRRAATTRRKVVAAARRWRRPHGGEPMASLGEGEGRLNLIAWAGYVEDGSTDPKVDWVTDFEKRTGCQVNVKVGNTSDEMVTLMRTGRYDARVGLRRRDAAAHRRRRRGAGRTPT